ncbi:MAG TPA: MBL fold metallo-hydrolase [Gemmatimonadales bacterium]|nr:MBL fold metallo-hydrolase [Gemmatimonadales bacterium]
MALSSQQLPVREVASGVYVVLGDTGRGSEGRPNAGFIVTGAGVVVIDALASPAQGEQLVGTIRSVTRQPIRWLVLTHHHPDHHFGAIALRRAGARVIAHPDVSTGVDEQSREAAESAWTLVVGKKQMAGFAYADGPDIPVTEADTLRLGRQTIVVGHPWRGPAHTVGDLIVWLPGERVLFAGDLLIEDGVTMVVDGTSLGLVAALDTIAALRPRIAVPGHGALPRDPAALIARTRGYIMGLRAAMRGAIERHRSLNRALDALPPADDGRPVSLHSRERRNANRVYLEVEKDIMGLEP